MQTQIKIYKGKLAHCESSQTALQFSIENCLTTDEMKFVSRSWDILNIANSKLQQTPVDNKNIPQRYRKKEDGLFD